MIIGNYLCSEVLKDFTIEIDGKTIPVQSSFDDQFALEKLIAAFDRESLAKFPMIFCVTNPMTGNRSKRQIIIMTNTNPDWLSKDRTANSFTKIIQPIYEKLIKTIDKSSGLRIWGDRKTRVQYTDKTNYGILKGANSKKNAGSQSGVTDYIDARIIELELEHSCSCCTEWIKKP